MWRSDSAAVHNRLTHRSRRKRLEPVAAASRGIPGRRMHLRPRRRTRPPQRPQRHHRGQCAASPYQRQRPRRTATPRRTPANIPGDALVPAVGELRPGTPDAFLKKQIEDGFMKETGATVNVEFVNANDIQPKTSAAIQQAWART